MTPSVAAPSVAAPSSAVFAAERVEDVFDEIRPLLEAHWREIEPYKDIPLDPDWEGYAAVEAAGALRVFTARCEGCLIGYEVFFVRETLHSRHSKQAVLDCLFIHPGHRGFGARFLRWCESRLQAEGVQVVFMHVSADHDLKPLLLRLGYHPHDVVYSRRLDHGR